MNGYTEYDESLLEDYESGEPETDEAARPRTFQPLRKPKGPQAPLYKPPTPNGTYVTHRQLETALTRVGAQIKTNVDATQAVTSRANSIGVRLDGEIAKRKKDHETVRKQLQNSSQMAILPLLLQTPPKITVTDDTKGAIQGSDNKPKSVSITDTSSSNLLPLVLIMSMGGMGGGLGSDSKDSGDNNMMMLMAVLLLSQPKQ
jgi:hypothetical protein